MQCNQLLPHIPRHRYKRESDDTQVQIVRTKPIDIDDGWRHGATHGSMLLCSHRLSALNEIA